MSSGAKTSSIPRPSGGGRRAAARDATLLGDLTRPIPAERQLVTHRGRRWMLGLAGTTVLVALLAALFTLPVKNYLRQQDQIRAKQAELAVLTAANEQLGREVARLETADGAAEAARSELGVVLPGERRVTVLPTPDGVLPLPSGWPYDTIVGILTARAASPATPVAPATAP